MKGFSIRCNYHTYVTLEYDDKFIMCFDNDVTKAEEIIYRIEKRTQMKFREIPVKGSRNDFTGLLFFKGGWARNFWDEFPNEKEIASYMNLRLGR